MSIEIVGMITPQHQSEIHAPQGPAIDREYTRRFAQAHEAAGFDRILAPQHSSGPDASQVIAYAAAVTDQVHFLLAHRPGFIGPAFAARQLATLENFTGGRLAVHIISGGSDEEQRRDGDFLDHDARYARTDEYLDVVRRTWTAERPFNHHGALYRYENAYSEVKPLQRPHIPIFFGGASEAALRVAGQHADTYALWGEPLDEARDLIRRVRAEAARHGRQIRFSVSFRPILADTEARAWARADRVLEQTQALRERASRGATARPAGPQQSVGASRLLKAAERGDVVDERLWTAVARISGARSNSTALVGTPEQVAQALARYVDLGVGTLLIRGFDPLEDASDFGRELIPRLRALVAEREARGQNVHEEAPQLLAA